MANYMAIDVGGTNVKYSLMTDQAEILEKGEFPTPYDEGLQGLVDGLKKVYDSYADRNIEALVMSAPGKIDATKGYFYTSGALHYIDGINLGDVLKDVIPVPFAVENDAKAAALAEIWKGSLQGIKDAFVMVLGTGIGGAVVIDGKLYRGHTFAAGEFSGIPMNLYAFPMEFGNAWAVTNGVGRLVDRYARLSNQDPEKLNGRILFDAANHGDEYALQAIDDYTKTIASGIMGLQFTLDVQRVAVGGGISKQPLLMDYIRKNLTLYYSAAQQAMALPATAPEVVPCTFGNDANMIGALYHYLYELKGAAK